MFWMNDAAGRPDSTTRGSALGVDTVRTSPATSKATV